MPGGGRVGWQICYTITLLKSLIKTRMTSVSVMTYKEQQPKSKLSIKSTFVCYSRVTSCDFPKWRACLQAKRTTTFLNQFTLQLCANISYFFAALVNRSYLVTKSDGESLSITNESQLTLKVPIVTKINFLLTISIHCQQISYKN